METSKTIKALIIEDEEPARALVKHYLQQHPDIELAGECADGFCGLKEIREQRPDLIFLDVQMPKLTGFELLELLDEKPEIIFTTAFDEYAIKAFDMNAVDYLLKPFPQDRFDNAVKKAVMRIRKGIVSQKSLSKLSEERPEGSPSLSRIVVNKGGAISFIPVQNIKYIEAEDDYVMIFHTEGKALKQQTMKFYENNLPADDFIRVHRSYLAAISHIVRIEPYGKDTHKAILQDGTRLSVSRTGYKKLKEKINF